MPAEVPGPGQAPGGAGGQGSPVGAQTPGDVTVQAQQSGPSIKVCAGSGAADDCTAITSTEAGSQTFTVRGTGWTDGVYGVLLTACVLPDTGSLGTSDFFTHCDTSELPSSLTSLLDIDSSQIKAGAPGLTTIHVSSSTLKNSCGSCEKFSVSNESFTEDITAVVPSNGVAIGVAKIDSVFGQAFQGSTVYQALSIEQTGPPLDGLTASNTVAKSVALSWTDPSGCASASPACIYEFRHRKSGGSWPNDWTTASSSTSHTVASLESGVEYEFQVRVRQGTVGSEDVLALGSVTATTLDVPSPPTGLYAAPNRDRTQYDLRWTAPATDMARADVTGYKIEWSADGATGWTDLTTVGASATTHSDTGLTAGTTRFYRVTANSAAGYSESSNTAPPSIKVCYAPNQSNNVDSGDGTNYNDVKASADCDPVESVGEGKHVFTVVGKDWVPTILGNLGVSLTACLAPDSGNLADVSLFEDCDTDGLGALLAGFVPGLVVQEAAQVLTILHGSVPTYSGFTIANGPVTLEADGSFVQNLVVNAPAGGVVIAAGSANLTSISSAPPILASANVLIDVIAVIQGFAAASGAGTVTLNWTNPSSCTAAAPTCTYRVRHREAGSGESGWGEWTEITSLSSSMSHTVTGLEAGASYDLELERRQGDETLAASSATETLLDVPSAPTGLTATPNPRKTRYDLSWTAPASDTARADVMGYRIDWSADGISGWSTLATKNSSATAHRDSRLPRDTIRRTPHPPPRPGSRSATRPTRATTTMGSPRTTTMTARITTL